MSVIIGTAGHVDHGKTCLIKALTGTDTDRLAEEKRRGITIELGFADMKLKNGDTAGIIDVPGHEKFIRNMLAGIGGIDLVLLVIAADEGIMPQTAEHMDILRLLDIQNGIIVLTKTDMVEKEWLEMVSADIRETVAGTFLQEAPLVAVSAHTGENIDKLKDLIEQMTDRLPARNTDPSLFRLPIDRVFTIDGFGTVVTGTLLEGKLCAGDQVMLYPAQKSMKVRNLQVHGDAKSEARAGQRTAVNLAGVKKEELQKGDVLAMPASMELSMMLDVKLKALENTERTLKNGSRLHLYYGAAETLCKVVLLDRDVLSPGEECYAQLRLEEKLAVKKDDKFVVRFYSPVETVGGGRILEAAPCRHTRYDENVLKSLQIKEQGSPEQVAEQIVREKGLAIKGARYLALKLSCKEENIKHILERLAQQGKIIRLEQDFVVHAETMAKAKKKLTEILMEYHKKNPLMQGMPVEEFRRRFLRGLKEKDTEIAEMLIKYFARQNEIRVRDSVVGLADFCVSLTPEQEKIKITMERMYKNKGFEAPGIEEVLTGFQDKKGARQMIQALVNAGVLIRLDAQYCMHIEHWDKALATVRDHVAANGKITLGEYRDLIGTSRKYAMMILDAMDAKKITKKVGDERILG